MCLFTLFLENVFSFSNPLVPCDAITIPVVNLAAWKDGYHVSAPVHVARGKVSAPLRLSPANKKPTPSNGISPYNFHHSPVFSSGAGHAPSPAPYSLVSVFTRAGRGSGRSISQYNSLTSTKVKPFVHNQPHRFNINYGK